METNVLRILILIILFFLLTCEYSTFISKLLIDDNETEVITDVNKPNPITRRSKDKSYYNNEISLSDVINGNEGDNEEEEEDDNDENETESNKESMKSKCKYSILFQFSGLKSALDISSNKGMMV